MYGKIIDMAMCYYDSYNSEMLMDDEALIVCEILWILCVSLVLV